MTELLKIATDNTRDLLKENWRSGCLSCRKNGIIHRWKKYSSRKDLQRAGKKHETWDKVLAAIDKAFDPFKKKLKREITREDIIKLTEKPVRRIYRLDINELNDQIKGLRRTSNR